MNDQVPLKRETTQDAREELARLLEETRRKVEEAGAEPAVVDEAIAAARRHDDHPPD